MAGPSIAKAEVTVDLDGKRLIAEAKALGEEAGEEAGKAHADAFTEEAEKGYKSLHEEELEKFRTAGKESGGASGEEFNKAFESFTRQGAKDSANELAKIFSEQDFGGLDKLKDSFKDVDFEVDRVDRTLLHVAGLLKDVSDNGTATEENIHRIVGDTNAWAENSKVIAEQTDRTKLKTLADDLENSARAAQNLADESDIVQRHLAEVRDVKLNNLVDDFFAQRDAAAQYDGKIVDLKSDMKDLSDNYALKLANELDDIFSENHQDGLKQYQQKLSAAKGSFVEVGDVVKNVSDKIDEFGRASGTSQGHLDVFRGSLRGFAEDAKKAAEGGLGDVVRDVENLGSSSDRSSKKTNGLRGALGKLLQSTSSFDPTDNPLQLFLLALALAGPLAPLVSALGAQVLILGTAAGAAAFGVGGLVAGFIGLSGKFGPLNKDATAAAGAFKGLLDPLKELGRTLTNAEFSGLAKPFEALGDALPKLGPGVTAIGKALNGFLGSLSGAVTNNIGAISGILSGFAPIIKNLGGVFISLGGIIGGIFKAATPFADAFTSSLEKSTKKFSDFLNSTKGQNGLTKFFSDAQPVMAQVIGVFDKVGAAFDAINTKANASSLKAVLGGIGDAVGALLRVGGSIGGTVGAVGTLLSLLSPIVAELTPVGEGFSNLISDVVKLITPVIGFITTTLAPVFATIGKMFDTLGAAFSAFTPVFTGYFSAASDIIQPVVKAVTDLVNAYEDLVQKALKIAGPAIEAFGKSLSLTGKAIGELVSGFIGAGKQTDAFKGTATGLQGFLNGPFKDAVSNVAGFFNKISAAIRDNVIPSFKEIDWSKVTKGLNEITGIIPKVIDAIGAIAEALGANIAAFAAWAAALLGSVGGVVSALVSAGKVVGDVLSGDFGAAAKDGGDSLKAIASASTSMSAGVADALKKTSAAVDTTGNTIKRLKTDTDGASAGVKAAFKDFSEAGAGNLGTLSKKLGLTGDASAAFRAAVVANAKDSGTSLSDVANAKSLPDLISKLGDAGSASKTKFANQIIAAMNESGDSIGKLPPQIQALIAKYGTIPKNVKTDVQLTGAAAAISEAGRVGAALAALPNAKTINITQITKNIAQGTAAAVGGIMLGGQLIAGGRHAFALGGIVSSPYSFGNVLTGESGAEAIVPLSRPLSQVDPSVRNLAAYAQGLRATTDKTKGGAYIAAGAIQLVTPASDTAVVASQVIDRLVPLL